MLNEKLQIFLRDDLNIHESKINDAVKKGIAVLISEHLQEQIKSRTRDDKIFFIDEEIKNIESYLADDYPDLFNIIKMELLMFQREVFNTVP